MTQDDDRSVFRSEALQRGFDVRVPLAGQGRLERVALAGNRIVDRLLWPAGANRVERFVDDDPVHPAEELVVRIESGELAIGFHEGVLGDVPGVFSVAD